MNSYHFKISGLKPSSFLAALERGVKDDKCKPEVGAAGREGKGVDFLHWERFPKRLPAPGP